MLFRSYRAKLVVYMVLLIIFLSVTLGYSYRYVQQVFLDEVDSHLLRLQQLLDGHLKAERNELQRYATIVAQDLRLKEYMYVITGIGGDSEPLNKLYEREFGWLPIDRRMIMTHDNQILVGTGHADLVAAIRKHSDMPAKGIFYFQGKSGLEVVAVATIKYRDNVMGRVAVSRLQSQNWLDVNKEITGGEFFLIKDKSIIKSTLSTNDNPHFDLRHNRLMINSASYRIYQIDLPGINNDKPQLWFGLSENEIVAKLDKHRGIILSLLGIGIIGVLVLGILIIRNFSRPLNQIMHITRQVAAGELPALEKQKVTNEFDELSNHFADMLKALREQQWEIEKTHRILEQSAITDVLTGLYNRRYLQDVFPKLLASMEREELVIYAILLDLDYFKKVNDTFGHLAGDECLASFAEQLQHISRASDYVFRLGGEEFLVLSVHDSIIEAASFAEKIRAKIEKTPVMYEQNLINLTVSGGISAVNSSGTVESVLEDLLLRADEALYNAKRSGRNRICLDEAAEDSALPQQQLPTYQSRK